MCSKIWQSEFLVYLVACLLGKKVYIGLLRASVPNCDPQLSVAQ